MAGTERRRRFDAQFKMDALRLTRESDRTISDIARDLGIRRELLYKWKREVEADPEDAFPGKGRMKPDQEKLHHLEQELARVRQERDILKKALAYFSRNER
jgi:transposase